MKLFSCQRCHQVVFFESTRCTRCGTSLHYLQDRDVVSAVAGDDLRLDALAAPGARYRACANRVEHDVCNWAVPEGDEAVRGGSVYCQACRLNRTIPNLATPGAREAWARLEAAKRRLLYALNGLGLPVEPRSPEQPTGLAFDFLVADGEQPVSTGYCDGVVTIDVAEADDPVRERVRVDLGETYRTLLGHFRHEIGHYYWARLVAGGAWLERFRALFGDEREDYEAAKQRHYASDGAAWQDRFVSRYASMHPWEDWAETWAHYLHVADTLETARAFGLSIRPATTPAAGSEPGVAPGTAPALTVAARRLDLRSFDDLVSGWVPLTVALNSLSRSMGLADVYPFVLPSPAIEKLAFVHEVIEAEGNRASATRD